MEKEKTVIDGAVTFAQKFEAIFARLLAREEVDLYAPQSNVSRMFEIIAARWMADIATREFHWYDGVVGLSARVRKARQIEFKGEMWVGDGHKQWKEDFTARVTDKRNTKQGLWLSLRIGEDTVEGDLDLLDSR